MPLEAEAAVIEDGGDLRMHVNRIEWPVEFLDFDDFESDPSEGSEPDDMEDEEEEDEELKSSLMAHVCSSSDRSGSTGDFALLDFPEEAPVDPVQGQVHPQCVFVLDAAKASECINAIAGDGVAGTVILLPTGETTCEEAMHVATRFRKDPRLSKLQITCARDVGHLAEALPRIRAVAGGAYEVGEGMLN